jgi:ribosomal RNA-processing protein 1
MDKYLYLIRQFFYASLRSLARAGWKDSELLDDLMGSIAETPVNARDAKIPNGLRYHMLDIYVDELEKLDDEHEAELPVERLLAPIMVLQKGCPTKSIRKQAKEVLEDERVRNWLGLGDVEDAEANEGAGEDAMPQGQEDDDEGDWKGID